MLSVVVIVASMFGVASRVAADTAPPEFYCNVTGAGSFHPALHTAQVISNGTVHERFR